MSIDPNRVAAARPAKTNPILCPGAGDMPHTLQREPACLAGMSRQRVSDRLPALQAQPLIRVDSGGLPVPALDALRSSIFRKQVR